MRSEVISAEYVVGELDLRPSLQMLLSQTPWGVDSYSRPGGFSGPLGHWEDRGDLTPLLRPADH